MMYVSVLKLKEMDFESEIIYHYDLIFSFIFNFYFLVGHFI